jgi:chromosome segregation ATPase
VKPQLENVDAQIKELDSEIGILNDKMATQQEHRNVAEQEVQRSVANLARWQAEIDFIAQLDSIKQELQSARDEYIASENAAQEAANRLAEVEQEATYARNLQTEAQQKVESLNQKMRELKGINK